MWGSVRGAACKECAWGSAGERALGSSSVNVELERASRSLCGEPKMAGFARAWESRACMPCVGEKTRKRAWESAFGGTVGERARGSVREGACVGKFAWESVRWTACAGKRAWESVSVRGGTCEWERT